MKHAILLVLIEAVRSRGPLRVVETHAGAGLYDLRGEAAQKSSEAEGGVGRLMTGADLPAPLERLREAVLRHNAGGALRVYPGSPLLALEALGDEGAYTGFELRSDDFASLQTVLGPSETRVTELELLRSKRVRAQLRQADGYEALPGVVAAGDLVLIDPPFERGDDYDQAAKAVGVAIARKAAVAVWIPIKDLETLDAFLRRVEARSPTSLAVAEVRLRPLANPMKMNGCAMVLVDTPNIDVEAAATCDWVARTCGEAGGWGRVTRLD